MANKKFSKDRLIEILVKLANGFYYSEEQIELQKTQKYNGNLSKSNEIYQNISFFDNYDTVCATPDNSHDKIKIDGYGKENDKDTKDLTISKKKITTHYVPPDISAIKILFEIFDKEVNSDDISNLSDKDLLDLKNKLIKELSNEN